MKSRARLVIDLGRASTATKGLLAYYIEFGGYLFQEPILED